MTFGKRLYKVRRRGDTCTNCGLCIRTCSMGIHIPEKDAVVSGECIQCMQCLSICPKESLSANPAGAIAGTAAAAVIGGTVVVDNLVSFPASETIADQQVTVEDGYIADIAVLSFQDDREFFQKAQSAVISDILAEQTSDVDAVSGATFSSNGIMDAVADALGRGQSESSQPVDSGKEDAAGDENVSESGKPGAEGESGAEAGQPGAGTGNGHGSGKPGAGRGNGHGAGHQGNGRHGGGWRGGSGGGGHRGRGN